MKKIFFDTMDQIMEKNPDVYLLMAGLGYPRTQEFLDKYPGRAINTEASEQSCLDIAVGLAYSGKIPVVYTITPFLYRGFETIRTYIDHENLNVKMVGVGRNDDYSKHDGYSHDANDDAGIFQTFSNIVKVWPFDDSELIPLLKKMVTEDKPWYINLKR